MTPDLTRTHNPDGWLIRAAQRLLGGAAQSLHRLPWFPGQWRLASLLTRLSPRGVVILRDHLNFLYYAPIGSHVSHLLLRFGKAEPEILDFIPSDECGFIVDVGSHIGTFALPASRMANQVIAIDADATLCDLLKKTCLINQVDNVRILNLAISTDPSSYIPFYRAHSNTSISSMDWAHVARYDTFDCIDVPNATLSQVLTQSSAENVDLIKVDVEGRSGDIMQSLGSRLGDISVIICEPSPDASVDDLRRRFSTHQLDQPLIDRRDIPDYTRETIVLRKI